MINLIVIYNQDHYFSENKIACVSLVIIILFTGLALGFGFSTVTDQETTPEYHPLCKLKLKLSIRFQTT